MAIAHNQQRAGKQGLFSQVLFFVACILLSVSAFADPPIIDLAPALAPYLVPGKWQSVIVTLKSPVNAPAINGEVQVTVSYNDYATTTYVRPVVLPAGAGNVRLPFTVRTGSMPDITVTLRAGQDGTGERVAERGFSKISSIVRKTIVVAVSPQPDSLRYLQDAPLGRDKFDNQQNNGTSQKGPKNSVPLTVASVMDTQNLPENVAGYDIAGMVYFSPEVFPDALSDSQVNALHQWVARGGLFVIGRTASAEAKVRADERFRTWVPFVAPSAHFTDDFAVRQVGRGTVCTIGFDTDDPAFIGSAQRNNVWRKVLNLSITNGFLQTQDSNDYGFEYMLPQAALHAPGIAAPGIIAIGGFLVTYLVLLLPVNYLLLKRFKKREWAWGTIPAMVVVFSLGAYGFGYSTKGTQTLCNTVSIIELTGEGGVASVTGAVGIFSPNRTRYNVKIAAPDGLFWSPNTYSEAGDSNSLVVVQDGVSATVRSAPISMWAMRSFPFRTESLRFGDGITANVQTIGKPDHWERVVGTVTNRTGLNLHHIVVRRGDVSQEIGTLKPGETAKIEIDRKHPHFAPDFGIDTSRNYQQNGQSARKTDYIADMRNDLVQGLHDTTRPGKNDGLTLTAWCDDRILPITINNGPPPAGSHVNFLIKHLQ